MQYRSDIDGLRSVAVVPIVLFHAGVDVLQGGFLGVDIFFVISGFLITSIIQREMAEGRFSLVDFYKRRVARIFPALLFMLSVVLIAGCLLMLPFELERLGNSALATALFVSNMYYWFTLDYFSSAAETDPLLHTWSLGVEEQFYIFYPIFLLLLVRYRWVSLKTALIALIGLSIAASIVIDLTMERGAFYLLPARVWQLGLGALVAVWRPQVKSTAYASALAWLGMGLMLLGYIVVRSDMMVPVPWSVLASGGAALVIACAQGTSVDRLLSLAPLRWIGAISYSLYLWHWPIITFWRLETGLELDWHETVMLCAASVMAAAISYYLVEQPLLRRYRNGRPWKVVVGGTVAVAPVALAAVFIAQNPAIWRSIAPETRAIENYAAYTDTAAHTAQFRTGTCFHTSYSDPYDRESCTRLSQDVPNIVLLGDSHAAQYAKALDEMLGDARLVQLTVSACPMLVGGGGTDRCSSLTQFAYDDFFDREGIDAVIIASRWKEDRVPLLNDTLEYLAAREIPVAIIGSVYEFEGDLPLLLARAMEMGAPEEVEAMRIDPGGPLESELAQVAAQYGASFYSVRERECDAQGCHVLTPQGVPLHFDYGHVTDEGARFLLRDFPVDELIAKARRGSGG